MVQIQDKCESHIPEQIVSEDVTFDEGKTWEETLKDGSTRGNNNRR